MAFLGILWFRSSYYFTTQFLQAVKFSPKSVYLYKYTASCPDVFEVKPHPWFHMKILSKMVRVTRGCSSVPLACSCPQSFKSVDKFFSDLTKGKSSIKCILVSTSHLCQLYQKHSVNEISGAFMGHQITLTWKKERINKSKERFFALSYYCQLSGIL